MARGQKNTNQNGKRHATQQSVDQAESDRGELVLYQNPDGVIEINVRLHDESIWLNQKQMSLLFDKDTDTIGLHLRNIFKEGELEEAATTEEYSVVQKEGNRQ